MISKLLLLLIPLLFLMTSAHAVHLGETQVPNEIELGEGMRFYIVNSFSSFTDHPTAPAVGEEIIYSQSVQNTGTVPLTNVQVHSTLSVLESNFRSEDGICRLINSIEVICDLPDLAPSERFPGVGVGSFFYFTTIVEGSEGKLLSNEASLCADFEGKRFCSTDRAGLLITSAVEPDPITEPVIEHPVINVRVDGSAFTVSWDKGTVTYLVSKDGVIVEDWQPIEKSCPIAQGQCGPITSNQYTHIHQLEGLFDHCFRAEFEGFITQVCAPTEVSQEGDILTLITNLITEYNNLKLEVESLQTQLDEALTRPELTQEDQEELDLLALIRLLFKP